ncbi:cobalt ECF transporter T component CbiQ [Methyloversatilis discipulorum]|uniref:cobalt ECF transporter T component CbiQ n=1 Tax=Methyloversatilis discipulorum TaxID=1119528 RepID=UPI0003739E71|nr:cobalt ECF transporter T component CbiQ [Methyloversatilis discipulorum]
MIAIGIAPRSPLSHVDPRVRLLCVLTASAWIAATPRLSSLLVLTAGSLVLALVARVPARTLMRRLLALNAFMALVLVTLPLSPGGEVVYQVAGVSIHGDGLMHALRIVLAGHALVLLFAALVATMEPVTLAHALLHLNVPDKLVRILMFAIRYIDVLHDTRLRRERAMRARGFVARCDAHTLRTTAHLVGALVGDSLARAQRIEQAMRARGWRGGFPMLHHFHLRASDLAFGLLFAACLLSIGVIA